MSEAQIRFPLGAVITLAYFERLSFFICNFFIILAAISEESATKEIFLCGSDKSHHYSDRSAGLYMYFLIKDDIAHPINDVVLRKFLCGLWIILAANFVAIDTLEILELWGVHRVDTETCKRYIFLRNERNSVYRLIVSDIVEQTHRIVDCGETCPLLGTLSSSLQTQ